ncbi:probable tyrosyl-DNA phosphodiesterase [Trichogramma pretiosum]|uniref:probable tyrosyl-DNA phosphodiesterase n=1 Tax=Trichogramma pretiosum TaxID=7493 RepID=UPI0006C95F1F|nr:probable tyrosyl-DNA phosphodiesterase [Trichogramma pretiosum]
MYQIGLEDIKVKRVKGEPITDALDPHSCFSNEMTLSVYTWMKMYIMCGSNPEDRDEMRDVSIAIAKTFRDDPVHISEHGTFSKKFQESAPYHYFLSTVDPSKKTHQQPLSVHFHEIIDYTEGIIVESFHINFMVEISWILNEYMLACQDPKMTILYGTLVDAKFMYDIPFDVELQQCKMPEFGCHHSKISILKYDDNSVRIIISSANLYAQDWHGRTQGLWISPRLPYLPASAEDSEGESTTNFKHDIIQYLSCYSEPQVFGWISLLYRIDFSAVNVFFIGSVPGYHEGPNLNLWGHLKLKKILSEHVILPENSKDWTAIAQSSAVGVYGSYYQRWLKSHIVQPMSQGKLNLPRTPPFKFIYPTQRSYNNSFDSKLGVTCLMYNKDSHMNQKWIKDYLCDWKSDSTNRTKAMPHIKCYTRLSPDESEVLYFLSTSANLSKGAWGKMLRKDTIQYLANYEAGVLFIPQIMIQRSTFPVTESAFTEAPIFKLPFDLPLTPYQTDDEPFVIIRCQDARLAVEIDHHIYEKHPTAINIFMGKVPSCREYHRNDFDDIDYDDDEDHDDDSSLDDSHECDYDLEEIDRKFCEAFEC